MQNHALSGRIMQLRVMVLLGFSHRLLSNFPKKKTFVEFPKEERVQFLFVCVAPISLISVLLLRCATVELLKLCLQPPQGGHAMKQQAEIRIFVGFSKLWQHLGLVSKFALSWEE